MGGGLELVLRRKRGDRLPEYLTDKRSRSQYKGRQPKMR
jgi:hypothetical protein